MPRKKNNGRRRRRASTKPRMLSLGPTYPNGLITKHKYTDSAILSENYTISDVTANTLWSIRANSLFDPDRTNVGHQPLFYDEMCAIYNQYRVLGAKMKLRFVNICNEPVIVFGAHLGAPLSAGWDPDALMERKDVKSRILSGRSGGKNMCTMNLFYSPSKFYSQSKANLKNDPTLVGNPSGTIVPAKASYFEIGMAQIDSSVQGGPEFDESTTHKVKVYIDVEYTAFWNDRKLNSNTS